MHKAKNCVVTCLDFRLQQAYTDFFSSKGWLGESDVISVAGCSRDLVKPLEESHRQYVLRQIDLSIKLHAPDTIVIVDHQDCGGYAQDGTINQGLPVEEDLVEHSKWAKVAKDVLKDIYPAINVEVYFVHLDGKVDTL